MLLLTLQIAFYVQVATWALLLRPGFRRDETPVQRADFPVSVIVCFHNEEEHLAVCLEGILAQEYPVRFEVVLVDDNSTDRSTEIALAYAGYDDRVRVVYPGITRPGKKDALAFGIEQASYECLVLTDADCRPASNRWLAGMAGGLCGGKELVLGVSPYLANEAWLGRWQQFESLYTALKYLGFARAGLPYMGVGRNLAYTKSYYARQGGFLAHANLASGDDDLLVSGGAEAAFTSRVLDPEAWTWSASHGSFPRYLHQRQRHQSTGMYYPPGVALLLSFVALTHGLFYLLLPILFWFDPVFATLLYACRALNVLLAFRQPYRDLGAAAGAGQVVKKQGGWVRTVLLGDLLIGPTYLFLMVSSLFPRKDW